MCRSSALALLLTLSVSAQVLQIGVFSLFRPVELRVSPVSGALLVTTGDSRIILEGRQAFTTTAPVRVSALDGSDADFRLSIPGKIERRFHGILTVQAGDHKLIAVVAMDREVAVASVVAAEMPPATPMEALKAQAIVARAYFAASGPRHDAFDFCDSTHCQFLREWPQPSNDAFQATRETRGLVLAYLGKPFAALYSASCGGQTRSLDGDGAGYPYYSVSCDFCRRHSPGLVEGHQLGLCQRGAAGMARLGAGYREILDHYYPGTSVMQSEANAFFLLPRPPALSHSKD
ncbi:MAG: SpoIID/LytB domain-containing protein [Bryobacteraceae bacterium]|jgi:stage II sporulation protein D